MVRNHASEDSQRAAGLIGFVLARGVTRAGVVRAGDIVVEDEIVTEGCGNCPGYGLNLCCPPFIPPPGEFRQALVGYDLGVVLQMSVPCGSDLPREEVYHGAVELHRVVLLAEAWALEHGLGQALGLIGGNCRLCTACPESSRGCRDRERARSSLEANGINVLRLCCQLDWPIEFPVKDMVHWTGLLLLPRETC